MKKYKIYLLECATLKVLKTQTIINQSLEEARTEAHVVLKPGPKQFVGAAAL